MTMPSDIQSPPRYIELLPQIYRKSGDNDNPLVENYLKIFEKILTGEETLPEDSTLYRRKGLGQTLNVLPDLFYPRFSFLFDPESKEFIPPILGSNQEQYETDLNSYVGATYAEYGSKNDSQWQVEYAAWMDEMLDWMGQRIGLKYNPEWNADTRRYLAAVFMPYYRERGTVACLQAMLQIFLGNGDPEDPLAENKIVKNIQVFDLSQNYLPANGKDKGMPIEGYRVGVNMTLADGYVEGKPLLGAKRPYAWLVRVVFLNSKKDQVDDFMAKFNQLLDEEKPALGCCNVQLQAPFRVGPGSATQLNVNACLTSP
jgi:hypothetical protein